MKCYVWCVEFALLNLVDPVVHLAILYHQELALSFFFLRSMKSKWKKAWSLPNSSPSSNVLGNLLSPVSGKNSAVVDAIREHPQRM